MACRKLLCLLLLRPLQAQEGAIADGEEPYDCSSSTSLAARQWCCTHKGLACTPSTEFNCSEVASATAEQRQWCCTNEKIGCLEAKNATGEKEEPQNNNSIVNDTMPLVKANETYDCMTSGANASKVWSDAQKSWCCEHHSVACANESQRDSVSPLWNCSDGLNTSTLPPGENPNVLSSTVAVGSTYAAAQKGKAGKEEVLTEAGEAGEYDCVTGASNWKLEWTNEQAVWCCKFHNVSCNAGRNPYKPVSSQPFDCNSGPIEEWSRSKQQWCCKSYELGCTLEDHSTTSQEQVAEVAEVAEAEQFDCKKAGFWSIARQDWCCKEKGIGCYTCTSDAQDWFAETKLWCCEHRPSAACDEEVEQFQCSDDVETWSDWSETQREWCCKNKKQGCEPDCDVESFPHYQESERIWCCKEKGIGCPEQQTNSALYDCFADEIEEWSEMKSHWCCFHMKRGCPMFDCEDGYSNWRLGFSESKKTWCCDHYGMACESSLGEPGSERPFSEDPDAAFGGFQSSYHCEGDPQEWSSNKVQWCCLVEHRGCLSDLQNELLEEPYDCSDVANSGGWPPEKSAYCCWETWTAEKGLGCEVESGLRPFNVPAPEEQAEEDDSSFYFVLLLLAMIVGISFYRAKSGNGRRSFSFGPSSFGTTYGRGVYSALGSRSRQRAAEPWPASGTLEPWEIKVSSHPSAITQSSNIGIFRFKTRAQTPVAKVHVDHHHVHHHHHFHGAYNLDRCLADQRRFLWHLIIAWRRAKRRARWKRSEAPRDARRLAGGNACLQVPEAELENSLASELCRLQTSTFSTFGGPVSVVETSCLMGTSVPLTTPAEKKPAAELQLQEYFDLMSCLPMQTRLKLSPYTVQLSHRGAK
eukprot:Skav223193  [mRNA]  locus=scaffold1825:80298:94620:- [translate_table: standard]